jgi:hypothetical protein
MTFLAASISFFQFFETAVKLIRIAIWSLSANFWRTVVGVPVVVCGKKNNQNNDYFKQTNK